MASPSMMAAGTEGSMRPERGIAVRPIISVASEDASLPSRKQHLAAIAVIFDFVNPVIPLRGLIDERCELRLDEYNARHAAYLGMEATEGRLS
jgi:hypothetical protein